MDKKLLLELKEYFKLSGNKYINKIFENHSNSDKELIEQLQRYNRDILRLMEDMDKEERLENEAEGIMTNGYFFSFIYLNEVLIDYKNIARVELGKNYDIKKKKILYFIKFIKKYPSPEEEFYILNYDSEDNRDKDFEILNIKLKACKCNII